MSFLDQLLGGYKVIQSGGSPLITRSVVNIISGATVVDNPGQLRTDITILGSGVTYAGDLSGTTTSQTVVGIQGKPVSGSAPIDASFLVYNGASYAPQKMSTDAVMSDAGLVTVQGWGGKPLGPSMLAPTTNFIPQWSGSQWNAVSADNAGPLFGEVTGTQAATVVSGPFSTASLTWLASVVAPALSQVAATSDVVPQNLTLRAQGPFASAVTNLLPGSTIINIPSVVGAASLLGGVQITYGGNRSVTLGPYGGAAGGSASYHAIWFGSAAPSAGDYAFLATDNRSITYLNANSQLYFAINGAVIANTTSTIAAFGAVASATTPVTINWGASTTPTISSGTSATSLTLGTNLAAASALIQGGAAVTGISITAPGNTAGTATTTITGALQDTTITITSNRTIDTTSNDSTIFVDTSGGVISLTLPTPTNGRRLWLIDKKSTFGTNNLTIVRHAAEKINNVAASKVLSASGYRGFITCDGTDWYV